jgi:hypothetical protein
MNKKTHPMIGRHCIVRTYSAGVFAGTVMDVDGMEVLLKDSQRIWYWTNAFTLSAVAIKGIGEDSRVGSKLPEHYVTQTIEFIPTTEVARKSYDKYEE